MNKQVVVGGGITGLFAALLLSEKYGGDNVLVVDKGPIGGLLRSFDYGEYGLFDIGTHIPAETGLRQVDERLEPFLTGLDWQIFEREKRDIAGVYFEGFLNEKSNAPDLNRLPKGDQQEIIDQIMALAQEDSSYQEAQSLEEFLQKKYGPLFTNKYLRPIFKNFYQSDLSELSPFAVNLMPIFRLHYFEGEEFERKVDNDYLRAVFAYPEQRAIPFEFTSGLRSFYPKKVGIQKFIDNICDELKDRGVEIKSGSSIQLQEERGSVIDTVLIDGDSSKIDKIYWTAGLIPYANFSNTQINFKAFDRPRTTAVVNLVFENELRSEGCYYYYDLTPTTDLYRVTLYQNFTERNSSAKATLEVITDLEESNKEDILKGAIKSLEQMGILNQTNTITFSSVELLPYGFPKPTNKNQKANTELREGLLDKFENVTLMGINTKDGLFFYRDILKDVYNEIVGI